MQLVAARYKTLSAEERAKWDEKAKADKKRYEEEMANYSAPEESDNDELEQPKKKAKKDKNAPTRARSAFIFFGSDIRDKIKSENADLSFAEVNKQIGERWKLLSSEEKEKYERMAATDKTRYKKEMASYTPPGESASGGKKKKEKKDPNAPKKAATSFFIFSNEMRPKLKKENPDIKFTDVGRKLGELFRGLSAEEKEKYEKLAQKDKARFKKEMEAYKSTKTEDDDKEDDGVDDDMDDDDDDSDDEDDD